jgi:hypothetical protein
MLYREIIAVFSEMHAKLQCISGSTYSDLKVNSGIETARLCKQIRSAVI